MSDNSAPAGRFLARVEFLKPDTLSRFARLRPICQVDDRPWRPVRDGDSRFLDEGSVFWWKPPELALEGSLWVITLAVQPQYGQDHRHKDKHQVLEWSRPYQALVLRGSTGPRAFRRSLASGRLAFDVLVVGRPLVRVTNAASRWIGLPETFTLTRDQGLNLVSVAGIEGVTPVFEIASDAFEAVLVNGHLYHLLLDPGIPVGYQCALSDAQLIEQLRRRVSSVDRKVLDGIGVTKKLLREYVDAIEEAGLGTDDAAKEEARVDAATLLVEGLGGEAADLDGVVDELCGYPAVKDGLERRLEDERQRRATIWEQGFAHDQLDAANQLAKTKQEIESATKVLSSLRSSIQTTVDEIIGAPVDALVRHGLIDAMRRALPTGNLASAHARFGSQSTGPLRGIETIGDLKQAAIGWSYGVGVDPYVMHVALAAVLAHRITLLSGANAERLAIALASTFAGDRAVRISVAAAVFGLADLMNTPASPVGATYLDRVPTFGDFLSAQAPQDTVAVILSGCNRAPLEVVLPEFLLPLGDGPRMLCWRRDDSRIGTAELSQRVTIIGTLHRGDATYRIGPDLSRQVGFVPADHRELKGVAMPAHSVPSPSRISPTLWDVLQNPTEAVGLDAWVGWLGLHGVGLPAGTLQRVLTMYLHLLGDPPRALAEALAGLILGREPAPDFADLPGTQGEWIRNRLTELADTPAWQEASHYFGMGDAQ